MSRPSVRSLSRVSLPGASLSWVASVLYLAVLGAGLYFQLAGLAPVPAEQTAAFTAVLVALLAGEAAQRGRRIPRGLAATLLAVRLGLYVLLSTVDPSGFAHVLFLLVPFHAYLSLGRRVAFVVAAGCFGLVTAVTASTPGWYRDTEAVSDLLMFAIGLVFALSMAAVATGHAAQAAVVAAVGERNRMARDIHDSLGHHLTAVSVQLEKAEAFRHRDEAASVQALADARGSARDALQEVRHSVATLRTGGSFALIDAVAGLAAAMGEPAVEVDVAGEESRYGGPALIALYRAAQEGLTNVRKHAAARRVSVALDLGEDMARLRVADDGRGFAVTAPTDGFGLRGMRERLESVGGTVQIESEPGGGTQLTVLVPRAVAA